MDNGKIDKAISFYGNEKYKILVDIELYEDVSSDFIIKRGKDLEAIAFKLDALFIAKNN